MMSWLGRHHVEAQKGPDRVATPGVLAKSRPVKQQCPVKAPHLHQQEGQWQTPLPSLSAVVNA